MTEIRNTDGIRELTSEEIAVVAGGTPSSGGNLLCAIEHAISCFYSKLSCLFNHQANG